MVNRSEMLSRDGNSLRAALFLFHFGCRPGRDLREQMVALAANDFLKIGATKWKKRT